MRISPSNGESISKIKKIAPETDSAPRSKATTTVALGGAKRPKLAKVRLSQKTSTPGMVLGLSYRSARIATSASVPN